MKRIIILAAALFVSSLSFAQGKKSLKAAQKALSAFSKDFSQVDKLTEAKSLLEEAFTSDEVSADAGSWVTRGEILMNVADAQIKQKLINPEFSLSDPLIAIGAVEAFEKALSIATKKGHKKDALKGLKALEGVLNNVGIDLYQSNDYTNAYENFSAELQANKALKAAGEDSRLDGEGLMAEKLLFAGLTGYYAEKYDRSAELLEASLDAGQSEPAVYQFLYEGLVKTGNDDKAFTFLQKGRELFPDNSGLLFSEINYYLSKGELEKMIANLETALEKEPDNVSVMSTLGQVYDQLSATAAQNGDEAKAAEYFDAALGRYKDALAKNPGDFNANYSLGAMYYNKAASYTEALNEAANDFSVAGNKKYEEIKAKMSAQFENALPYFQKADEINGKDMNTLIALKEIFVRKDMMDKSNEYKARIEALNN